MNTALTPLRKEKGVVLVLVALSLVALMGVAALAIDLSHAEVNKTRLQNLADALALSAAISLNKQEYSTAFPDKEAYAENYAKVNTFPNFVASSGNKEVQDALTNPDTDLSFTFAADWSDSWKAAKAIDGAKFARVVVNGQNNWRIATWFARVIGFDDIPVSASAVAGTAPINPCQNVVPIMMCAETTPSIDKNCDDDSDNSGFDDKGNKDCYGYERDVVYTTKESKWKNDDIGPGNFGLFDVGSGGSAIRNCLAGAPGCPADLCTLLAPGGTLISEPGGDTGPVKQGLNTRFEEDLTPPPDSLVSNKLGITLSDTPREVGSEFDPDKSYTVPPQAKPSAQIYNYFYKDNYLTSTEFPADKYIPGRRLITMPFVDCSTNINGKGTLSIVGFGCWFFTSPTNGKDVSAEFLGTEGCNTSGTPTSTNNFGFYKVQLYKDPSGGHS